MTVNAGIFLSIILLVSCNNSRTKTSTVDSSSKTILLTDSTRSKLLNELDTLVTSNSSSDDTTITGRFINQGKFENGDSYITVKTKNDSIVVLIDPMAPLEESEIAKLKKEGNNITLTYTESNKTVKILSVDYELQK